MRWHYICGGRRRRSGLVDLRTVGGSDAGGGERETGGGTRWRAQQGAFVVLLDFGLGERVEIGENVRPGAVATKVGDALLQPLLQYEGEEAAGHVTANGLATLWKIGRVANRLLAVRKVCSTIVSCL